MSAPCCGGELTIVGSRPRVWLKSSGDKSKIIVRRCYCKPCKRIHHELPDILVPYKRYDAESIESVVSEPARTDVAVDESTIVRWRCWFLAWITYAAGCLKSISLRYNQDVKERSTPSKSVLHGLGQFVGNQVGWLSRAVRPITNLNLWVTDPFCIHDRFLLR